MSKAYRIKRFRHVADTKRRRLLEEDLVPILDESSEQSNAIHASEIQNVLSEGDWLIEYRDQEKPLYIYKVKSYRHEPHLHLYVKHFVEIEHIYKMDSSNIPDEMHMLLAAADHLEDLPPHVFELVSDFHIKVVSDLDEKLKQLLFRLKLRRNVLSRLGRDILLEVESGRISEARLQEILQFVTPEQFESVRAMIPEATDTEWESVKDQVRILQWDKRVEMLFKSEDAEKVEEDDAEVAKDKEEVNDSIRGNPANAAPPANEVENYVRQEPARAVPPGKELVDPDTVTGAISKAALETYRKKHDGRLPTVEEFEKLTKRFSTPGTRRRSTFN